MVFVFFTREGKGKKGKNREGFERASLSGNDIDARWARVRFDLRV